MDAVELELLYQKFDWFNIYFSSWQRYQSGDDFGLSRWEDDGGSYL